MIKLALYQPEIPQNVGTLLRLSSCLGLDVSIIEPCGFIWDDRRLKRAGMDYLDFVNVSRYADFESFYSAAGRVVLVDVKAETSYYDFNFLPSDHLLLGQESVGVPDEVYAICSARVHIPMLAKRRSLNMAVAGAMVVSEALRQLR